MLQAVFGEWWDYRQRLRVGGLEGPVASTSRILGIPRWDTESRMMQAFTKEACNIIILNPKVFINRDSHEFNSWKFCRFPKGRLCGVGVTGGKSVFFGWWCGFATFRSWLVLCSIKTSRGIQEAQSTNPNQLVNPLKTRAWFGCKCFWEWGGGWNVSAMLILIVLCFFIWFVSFSDNTFFALLCEKFMEPIFLPLKQQFQ